MSQSIHFITKNVPGYGLSDGRCLPCSGVSGRAVGVSSKLSYGDYKILSHGKTGSLKCTSRGMSSACKASSSGHRRNPDFSRQNKHGVSRSRNRQNEERNGSENVDDSELFSSKNGPLLSLSNSPKFQATATPGPREKEIVQLFRKVQAQLRERTAIKEGKKIENLQRQGKESDTVDSLLKLLRKHSVQQGKRTSSSGSNSRDFILDQPEQNGPSDEEKSTSFFDSNDSVKDEAQEREPPSFSRPISNFRRRSPVPQIKFRSVYSDDNTLNSVSDMNLNGQREKGYPEPGIELETKPDVEPEPELELEPGFFDGMSEEETSDIGEGYIDDDVDEEKPKVAGDLSAMKLPELRALAKSRGVKRFSKLKKDLFKPSPPSSSCNRGGQMDTKSVRCLINSISRFIHLVSCQTLKTMPTQKSYRNMASLLKHLKSMLDDLVDYKITSDEVLCKECEELDIAVNEAREFMERWSPRASKICSVLQSEPLMMKIQSSSHEICRILCRLLQSSPSTSSLTSVQHCMQELQCLELERISEHIEESLKRQREGTVPPSEHLIKIIESLSLTSNQELLKESVALEKERMKAQVNKMKGELDQISHIIDLMSHIRNCMVKLERFKAINGVSIPLYFRCPLSLKLMLDPVIVASGQTYERASIQMWLDHGLTICPKTRQTLSHTNLIPNYTVKALIANWCEENNIKLSNTSDSTNNISASSHFEDVSAQDLIRMDSFHSSHSHDSTSRSSLEVGNGFQKQKNGVSFRFSEEESNGCRSRETEKFDHSSPEQSYVHSRSESTSSAISSIDYLPTTSIDVSRVSSKHENVSELSGEMTSECPASSPSNKDSGFSPWLSGKQYHSSKTMAEMAGNGNLNYPRTLSLPSSDPGSDDLAATSHVEKLVEDLKSQSNEVQTSAAAELRFLAKHNMENRVIIGRCGAIAPLLSLLHSEVKLTQEHAVTALLNLSINENIKAMIAEAGAIEPLIHVLKTGNAGAKENAAAALFSLSVLEEYRIKIGRSSAVKALVDLLGSGTLRGKKDAATALFNLSIFHENKARIIQAGAVKYLVELMDPATEMVDKAVALLANLSTVSEGCLAIARAGGIPLLVEVVDTGSQRGKENAASILLQLCINSPKHCRLVLQEGAVPPLVALSQSGTPRAKEKAQQLLSHFRNQREGAMGKGKS
ncbi:hypothetical protein F0562_021130 [Nyssa sinensis]|uniref:RING-type E3 ubiquitin transferase n=1 Tax=Nyssa sinensis TaxID=561372 RepID=A0A5J5BJS3_9ASTE|nr:hypothetical protein F0562_021130 [Nyssa sinensis]